MDCAVSAKGTGSNPILFPLILVVGWVARAPAQMPIPVAAGPQPAEAKFASWTHIELATHSVGGSIGAGCVDALGRRAVRSEPALRELFSVLEARIPEVAQPASMTRIAANQERAALWILAVAIQRAGRRPWPPWIRGKLEDLVMDSGCVGPPANRARFLAATYEVIESCSGPQGAQPLVASVGDDGVPLVLSWWLELRPERPLEIPTAAAERLRAIAEQPDEWLIENGAGLSARYALHLDGYAAARLVVSAAPDFARPWMTLRLALTDLALYPIDSLRWNAALSAVREAKRVPEGIDDALLTDALATLPADAQARVREAVPTR